MPARATEPEIVAEALELVRKGGRSPKQAAEELKDAGKLISYRTIYRALEAEKGVPAAEIVAVEPAAAVVLEAPVQVPEVALAVAFGAVDPAKAAAVRRMVSGLKFDAQTVERLAVTFSMSERDVRALFVEAAIAAGSQVLPPELAREESLAAARWVRDKAKDSHDFKSVLMAQAHIDRVQVPATKPGAPPDGMTQAEVTAMWKEIIATLRPWPAALQALRARFGPG